MNIRWCIVITTHNRAQMLCRAIESCLNQTVACEIVVVDDGSDDDTAEVIKKFPQLTYIRNPRPLGQSVAANVGISATSADWIKHLDDDDWLSPNCIELMTQAINCARDGGLDPVLISAGAMNVDINGSVIGRTRLLAASTVAVTSRNLLHLMMLDQAPIGTPAQVGVRREAALRVGGWNEQRLFTHLFGGDTELWIRLAAAGDAIFVPEYLCHRTIWAGNNFKTPSLNDRYLTNVHLKDLLAEHLGIRTPQSIKCYLALNWAIIGLRERNFWQSFLLVLKWLKRPDSVAFILHRRKPISAKQLSMLALDFNSRD